MMTIIFYLTEMMIVKLINDGSDHEHLN